MASLRQKITFKNRTLEGNEAVVIKLNGCIDKLYKYAPAHSMVASLRQKLNGQSCLIKEHYGCNNGTKQLLQANTPFGELVIKSQYSISIPNHIMMDILEEVDMDISMESVIDDFAAKFKKKVDLYTGAIKMNKEVNDKIVELSCKIKEYENLYDEQIEDYDMSQFNDKENYLIKFTMVRKKLLAELHEQSLKYNKYYNMIKKIFIRHTKEGNFPTIYEYKQVLINYDSAKMASMSLQRKIYLLYFDDEQTYNIIMNKAREVMVRENKSTIRVILNEYEYDDEPFIMGTII